MTGDKLTCIIPVRSFRTGKTRLSPALDDATRADLIRRMLNHTLEAATGSFVFSDIAVISLDPDVLTWTARHWPSIKLLQQSELDPGLIPALEIGRTFATDCRADGFAILFPDLPVLEPSDLVALTTPENQIVIAPDQEQTGTNALLVRRHPAKLSSFQFQFGVESFPKHLAEAARLNIEPATVTSAGLAFDLDTPADFATFQTRSPSINPHSRTGT
jgi:2-phospho-L-lactate guanylyltransferase